MSITLLYAWKIIGFTASHRAFVPTTLPFFFTSLVMMHASGMTYIAGTLFSTAAAILANLWKALCPVPASFVSSMQMIGSELYSTIKSAASR